MLTLDSLLLPDWWLYSTVFILGAIIGSFLNVYIYRFHTGKSLSGHSHCLSCGTRLKWYDLFPLLSYLGLRGRCRACGCRITVRYFLVELTTGLLFVGSLLLTKDLLLLLLLWSVMAILVVITVYDLYHFIIPDKLTAFLLLTVVLMRIYEYYLHPFYPERLLWGVGAALGGMAFFWLLWFISKGTWLGFGDVKLAFPLGLFIGPQAVFSFVILSFWVGAVVSLGILFLVRISRGKAPLHFIGRNLTMKSAVPFAPFLVASCLIIIFTRFNVLELFSFI